MHDCTNGDVRDLLPEYAHRALGAEARARVEAHLRMCETCREELELVYAVRALRSAAQVPDVSRIVAALPRPDASTASTVPGVVALDARRGVRARPLPWRRIAGIAAVFVGVLGIGVLGRRSGDGRDAMPPILDPVPGSSAVASASPPARVPSEQARVDTPAGSGTRRPPARAAASADAVGALGGITSGATEEDLLTLIGGLDSLTGIPEVEGGDADGSASIGGMR